MPNFIKVSVLFSSSHIIIFFQYYATDPLFHDLTGGFPMSNPVAIFS